MINKILKYFLYNRLITIVLLIFLVLWGISTAPFNWHQHIIPHDSVPVDAIPDIGENQQIVATEWMGRSPKDVQDQITYPLTSSLMGISGIKTIRSSSMFGMSFIYIIFEDNVDFYWSRSRILERLNSLPANTLPKDVQPVLGPDATALGQIFWYTLEGRDPISGKPTSGWSAEELRTIQDFHVKYALSVASGVSEVASIGGYVKEYQVDMNPAAMQAFGVSVMEVMAALKKSNLDIGAETVEINKVEYLVRGLGQIQSIDDIEQTVVQFRDGVPVRVKDVARVALGPAPRRGGLDKEGVEAVGGVVVARFGSNPMEVIENVKSQVEQISATLPQKTLEDGTVSRVTIVPFYDRSGLIQETIGTLETALWHEVLICIIVVVVLIFNLRASLVISSILPIAVLATFIVMRYTGVEANIVALSGIAIAIGVMVDVGIVLIESVIKQIEASKSNKKQLSKREFLSVIYKGMSEVTGALSTAILTTIVSFLPVFAMQGQEGKLFAPLAYTKTYTLIAAFLLGVMLLPTLTYYVFSIRLSSSTLRLWTSIALIPLGIILAILFASFWPLMIVCIGVANCATKYFRITQWTSYINALIALLGAVLFLSMEWMPLGTVHSVGANALFAIAVIAFILCVLWALVIYYEKILSWCLSHRKTFMLIPIGTLLLGVVIWQGFEKTFETIIIKPFGEFGEKKIRNSSFWVSASHLFPGMGEEFLPSLDEGSFLLMPTTMPHTGIEQNLNYIEILDKRIANIPEVQTVVGKWGRVNSALDPAPTQMFENIINYYPEYILDKSGRRERFQVDHNGAFKLIDGSTYNPDKDAFRVIPADSLIPHSGGHFFRQWRPHIKSTNDIWNEISEASYLSGITTSPKLQPIEARLVMLSTGMRAPLGLKVYGSTLESIEEAGKILESALKEAPGVLPSTVFYDRSVAAPYIEIKLDRQQLARYGIAVADLQEIIETALGGMTLTTTIEGRERFAVRLRYPREWRKNPTDFEQILVPTALGSQIPLKELAQVNYNRGAQMIQSENSFLLGYVIFDKMESYSEVEVVREAESYLQQLINDGKIELPQGVSYSFAGNYQQQERAAKRLMIIIPISLIAILLILYFQFHSITASLIHFSGVFVAFAGGFILLWLYGQTWFLNIDIGSTNLREVFQMHTIHLSIAVWVGFIALFGIATNDGVLMGTFIHETFKRRDPQTPEQIRQAVIHAGLKRVRPAAMTTATTLIALLPILTSTGKGSDIMIPMAIPTFGGMLIQSMTMFVVPVLQCIWRERAVRKKINSKIS